MPLLVRCICSQYTRAAAKFQISAKGFFHLGRTWAVVGHGEALQPSRGLRVSPGGRPECLRGVSGVSGSERGVSGTFRELPGSLRELGPPGTFREPPGSLRELPEGFAINAIVLARPRLHAARLRHGLEHN